ncbi:MAG: FAD-binding oxidoreductase, partial [Cyanobacteria bacterium P01_H01_bin.121]
LGGLMATAQAGSLRQRYGTLRDMVLGVQFVRADGQVAKAGGRVVKNVAGYDLMKLLTGSYGTLGIVTEVTLRVYPLPEAWQTVVLSGSTPELAQAAATIAASALTPVAFDVVSAGVLQALAIDSPLGLALRFGTMPVSIEQQTEQLKAIAQSLKLTIHVLREQQDREFWPQLTNSIQPDPDLSLCKFGVLPNAAVHVLDQLVALGGAETKGQIYRGTGVGWLAYPARSLTVELVQKWRSLCEDQGGFLSLLHAPPELKQKIDVWGYPGNATQTMQALKQQFDPLALLSPGCFVAGI